MRQSSTSGQPDLIFFTDRDLGRSVPAALRAGGLRVEAYDDHFTSDNVKDGEWLHLVGDRGWIALTHNKRIRWERDELDDLMSYGARTFFIIGKGPHAAFAAAVLRSIRKIRKLVRKHPPGPFAGRIYQERDYVDIWLTYQQWMDGRHFGRW
jgi:hypothetical protein